MIDSMFAFLIVATTLVAIIKRTEMALWLFIIASLGSVVAVSNVEPESALIFFCGANMILMMASFSSWRESRLKLPLLIGILASIDVVAVFVHYMLLLNNGVTSYACGIIAGTIGYIQFLLVCFMEDNRGALNDMLNSFRDSIRGALHISSNNKNSGRDN